LRRRWVAAGRDDVANVDSREETKISWTEVERCQ